MTPAQILELILGVLQFPGQILKLISALKTTPAEQHDALVKSMLLEAEKFKSTGRPSW